MQKKLSVVLVVVLSLLLVALPVMAKGGGNGSGNGGGNSSSSSSNSSGNANGNGNGNGKGSSSQSSVNSSKSDNGSSAGSEKTKITNGQSQKGQNIKSSINKVLKDKNEKQIGAVKEKLQQKRNETGKKNFTDTSKHWSKTNIEIVQKLGLMSGYTDGSFQPDAPITSVEAMVIAVNMSELVSTETTTDQTTTATQETTSTTTTEESTGTTTEDESSNTNTAVTDEIPDWAQEQAQEASKLKIVNMNRFHSSVQANRAQTAVMLAKALNLEPVDTSEYSFSDSVLISSEDLGYIMALREAGIVLGRPDGKFNPNSSITRAEVASMLAKAVENIEEEGTATESGSQTTGSNTTTTGDSTTGSTDSTGTTSGTTTGTTTTTGTGTDNTSQTGTGTTGSTNTTTP